MTHSPLTQDDVKELMTHPTPETLAQVTEKILDYYNTNQFTPEQSNLAEDIFGLLVKNIHVMVRKVMSSHLQGNQSVPHHIILELAKDTEEVAVPILQNSEVLTDDDLVAIINNTKQIARHLAIAKRKKVSELVSDSLANTKDEAVITQLLDNTNATISPTTSQAIRDAFAEHPAILESLSKRDTIIM